LSTGATWPTVVEMARLTAWLLGVEFAFVALGLVAGSSLLMARRAHFWLRVSLGFIVTALFALLLVVGRMTSVVPDHMIGLLWLVLAIAALLVGPCFCYRPVPSRGSSEGDDGGGGSSRDRPPPEPSAPRGDLPLEDAEQSGVRARDHTGPKFSRRHERRPARERPRRVRRH
jgi:hypothetical protein